MIYCEFHISNTKKIHKIHNQIKHVELKETKCTKLLDHPIQDRHLGL
jgi:hypothetical protein